MVLNEFGEDTLVLCDDVRLRRQPADRRRPQARIRRAEDALPMEDVETPGTTTIDALGDVPRRCPGAKTAKAAFFVTGDGRFVVAIVRGDYDVNETKLVERRSRRQAGSGRRTVEEIRRVAACRPVTARRLGPSDAVVVVDELVMPARRTSSRGEPRRLARPERQRPARLHAGRTSPRSPNAREGDPAPAAGRR